MATVRYFAAAAAAAGTPSEQLPAATLGALLGVLRDSHGAEFAQVLGRCSVLVDGVASTDPATPVAEGATVDVLPPFAGG
nr:MoaD/ThiS family protein [Propionibacterium sp.]